MHDQPLINTVRTHTTLNLCIDLIYQATVGHATISCMHVPCLVNQVG
uniref:Uncharacterized protein n=1 Tax=Arundo donax TaxID=35708 RepID=A0A0A9C7Z7_ARUDO